MKENDELEIKISNLIAYVWLVLMVCSLVVVIVWSATYHLLTAAMCFVMFELMYTPKSNDRGQTE